MSKEEEPKKSIVQTITLGDKCPNECQKPLTVFAKHHPRPDKLHVFVEWCREMQTLSKTFEGYMDTEIIRPTCIDSNEYIAIFRYDNYTNLQKWMQSKERQDMIDRIPEFSDVKTLVYSYHSLEHWFSSSDEETMLSVSAAAKGGRRGGPPTRYKMWIVTTGVIYQQTLWVPPVMGKIAPNLDPDVLGFLNTLVIVTLSTFVFFPIITRLLAFWLFPGCNYKAKLLELVPSFLLWKKAATGGKKGASDVTENSRTSSSMVGEDNKNDLSSAV